MPPTRTYCYGFFRTRTCVLPTWRGWLALLAVLVALGAWMFLHAYDFLAVMDPVPPPEEILVLEGWCNDTVFHEATREFARHAYSGLYVTGGVSDSGVLLDHYATQADRGVAYLQALGMKAERLHAVAWPPVHRDRTYTSALSLKEYLEQHHIGVTKINLISEACHSRRSRLLFQKALGPEYQIGVIAAPDPEVDPKRWWTTSAGVRAVIGEGLAYLYARFLFRST